MPADFGPRASVAKATTALSATILFKTTYPFRLIPSYCRSLHWYNLSFSYLCITTFLHGFFTIFYWVMDMYFTTRILWLAFIARCVSWSGMSAHIDSSSDFQNSLHDPPAEAFSFFFFPLVSPLFSLRGYIIRGGLQIWGLILWRMD